MNVGACKHRVGTGRAIVDSQTRSEPTRHACCVRERCNGRTVSGCGLNIVLSSRVQGAPLPQASGRRPGTHARGRRASCSRHACMRHRQHDAWHAQADALRVHAANAGARVCWCGHGAMCGTAPVHPHTPHSTWQRARAGCMLVANGGGRRGWERGSAPWRGGALPTARAAADAVHTPTGTNRPDNTLRVARPCLPRKAAALCTCTAAHSGHV